MINTFFYYISRSCIDYLRNIINSTSEICSSDSLSSPYSISVRGGRYDVDLATCEMKPAYWKSPDERTEVRRCLWFYLTDKRAFDSLGEEYWEFLEVNRKIVVDKNDMKKFNNYSKKASFLSFLTTIIRTYRLGKYVTNVIISFIGSI